MMQSKGWDLRHDDSGGHETQEASDADLGVAAYRAGQTASRGRGSCASGRRSAVGRAGARRMAVGMWKRKR
jgi:hypothetical protein